MVITLQLVHNPSLQSLFSLPQSHNNRSARASASPPPPQKGRRRLITETASAAAISLLSSVALSSTNIAQPALAAEDLSEWERVYLPIDPGVVLLDIAFVPDDPTHGFLLGTRQTLLETKDGGSSWEPRSIASAEEEDFNYRFNSISFKGKEGWIVGKPAILLYTSDAGDNWKRIPLSTQLPGDIRLHGSHRERTSKEERPRSFNIDTRGMCWDKAEIVTGRHPERWRRDSAGNIVFKRFRNCQGCLCYEFDHIQPFSKGGESVLDNCQILQTRVNRLKSDKEDLKSKWLRGYSCDISLTDNEMDIMEMAVYGGVLRPGKNCRVMSVIENLGKYQSKDLRAGCK